MPRVTFEIVTYVLTPRRGVKPSLNESHVLKALLTLYHKGPMGRQFLSRVLSVGEASARTLIRRLKELELVEVTQAGGAYLTRKGMDVVEKFLEAVIPPKQIDTSCFNYLKLSKEACFAILKGKCRDKVNVLKIRDSLIRYGANAALVMCVRRNKIILLSPGNKGVDENTIEELRLFKEKIHVTLNDNDLILVSFANSFSECESSLYRFLTYSDC